MKDLPITMDEPMNWINKTGGYAKDMTLRDYFAAKVVQAMMTHPSCPEQINATGLSQAAYEIADEMIKVGK